MALRVINLILLAVLLIWAVRWWKENHGAELYSAPVAIFAIHGLVFFSITIMRGLGFTLNIETSFLNDWSNGLRFHGVFTMLLLMYSIQRIRHRGI